MVLPTPAARSSPLRSRPPSGAGGQRPHRRIRFRKGGDPARPERDPANSAPRLVVAQRATVPYSATSRENVVSGSARLLGRIGLNDETSRQGLINFLRAPRYEVLPTEDVEDLVLAHVPHDVTITITASPRRGID